LQDPAFFAMITPLSEEEELVDAWTTLCRFSSAAVILHKQMNEIKQDRPVFEGNHRSDKSNLN